MKNGQSVSVFAAAIAALENEVIDLEHRATAARTLVHQLRDYGGITPAVPCQNQNRASRKLDRSKAAPARAQLVAAEAAVAELKKLAAEVGRLDGLIKTEKDAAALKHHVAAALRAERRGGEIVIGLAGKVRLPVAKAQRQRWCRAAALTPKQFEAKVERTAKAAVAALDCPKRSSVAPAPKPTEPVSRSDVPYKASNGVSLAKIAL